MLIRQLNFRQFDNLSTDAALGGSLTICHSLCLAQTPPLGESGLLRKPPQILDFSQQNPPYKCYKF